MWSVVARNMVLDPNTGYEEDKEGIEKYKAVVEPNEEEPLIKKYTIEVPGCGYLFYVFKNGHPESSYDETMDYH